MKGNKAAETYNPGQSYDANTGQCNCSRPQCRVARLSEEKVKRPSCPWFSDLMAGISNQIQTTVTQIAAATR